MCPSLPLFDTISTIASEMELTDMIRPLGTQSIRARRLINLSRVYLQDPPSLCDLRPSRPTILPRTSTNNHNALDGSPRQQRERYPPTPISHLPGTGPYALDSYRIFCTVHNDPGSDEWKNVTPRDKELIRYLVSNY